MIDRSLPALAEMIAESVILIDSDGIIQEWNTASKQLYGWSAGEAVGRNLAELFPRESNKASGLVERSRKNGQRRLVSLRRVPHHEAPDLTFEIGTDARYAEPQPETLSGRPVPGSRDELEQQYDALFRAVPVGLARLDVSALGQRLEHRAKSGCRRLEHPRRYDGALVDELSDMVRVEQINLEARRLVVFPYEEGGSAPLPAIFRIDQDYRRRFLLAMARQDGGHSGEARMDLANGTRRQVLLSATFLPGDGPAISALISFVDMTERSRAQMYLEHRRASVERSTRAALLGELALSVAHEVNQPLAALAANGAAARRWLDREPPAVDQARQLLERVVADASRASEVIASVREHAQRGPLVMQPVRLAALIEQVVEILAHEFDRIEMRPVIEVENADLEVMGERVSLLQVLINLVMNAVQAMEGCPPSRRILAIECREFVEVVQVVIADSGCGFAPANAEKIFDRFYSEKDEGLGLGLAITRSIVERHDGELQAWSDGYSGAKFTLLLPKADTQLESARDLPATPA